VVGFPGKAPGVLQTHTENERRGQRLPPGEAAGQLVPPLELLLRLLPAEIDPTTVEDGGEIQQTMFDPSLRKAHTERQDLLPDQALDLLHRPSDHPPVAFEIGMVRVLRVSHTPPPDDIQDLQTIGATRNHLPQGLNLVQDLPKVREKGVGLRHGKGTPLHARTVGGGRTPVNSGTGLLEKGKNILVPLCLSHLSWRPVVIALCVNCGSVGKEKLDHRCPAVR
jgi:hypothetical protein